MFLKTPPRFRAAMPTEIADGPSGDVARSRPGPEASACRIAELGRCPGRGRHQKGDGPVRVLPDIQYVAPARPCARVCGDRRRHARVGASTAIFAVVNAVLLKPLPFADAERLMCTCWCPSARAPASTRGVWSYIRCPDVHRVPAGVRRDRVLRGPRRRSLRRRSRSACARKSSRNGIVRPRRRAVDGTAVHLGRGAQGRHRAPP